MPQYMTYASGLAADTERGPSGAIWHDCPFHAIRNHSEHYKGFAFHDDFYGAGVAENSTAFAWTGPDGVKYLGFGSSGVTMNAKDEAAGEQTGILQLDVDADDEEAYLSMDTTYSAAFGSISDTSGDNYKLWFEGRVKFDDVSSGAAALGKVFGLANEGANVTGAMGADAASVAITSFVGFRALAADGDGMDATYNASGSETVHVESASGVTAQTLTAATWVKLGIKFDGTNVWWYCNGELVTQTGLLVSASGFPDAAYLNPFFGGRQHGTGDFELDIDWWRFAALHDIQS